MNVYYHIYKLHPLRAANHTSSPGTKSGVHLKVRTAGSENFADYFPHMGLGDKHHDEFLETFKYQENEYEQKVFHFLLNEHRLREQKQKLFFNHELWDGKSSITSPVIKYKLQSCEDFSITKIRKKNIRVRLDANGIFKRFELLKFCKELGNLEDIEYLEDPMEDLDWSNLPLNLARDFLKGSPHQFCIHKPNARFYPKTEEKVIFSSYMGSDLGRWHTYCELMEKGNLNEYHGILTPTLYQEEQFLFKGNYQDGFSPEDKSLKKLYDKLINTEWKLLCSI